MGIHLPFLKAGQVFPVNIVQLFRHIHISVEVNIAVGRMVIASMKI